MDGWYGACRRLNNNERQNHQPRHINTYIHTDGAAHAVEGHGLDVLEGDVERGLVDEDEGLSSVRHAWGMRGGGGGAWSNGIRQSIHSCLADRHHTAP